MRRFVAVSSLLTMACGGLGVLLATVIHPLWLAAVAIVIASVILTIAGHMLSEAIFGKYSP